MSNGIVPLVARAKIAAARRDGTKLPRIKYFAFGSGGVSTSGIVLVPTADITKLNKELLRKEYDSVEPVGQCANRYSCTLKDGALSGKSISEIALIDEEGDLAWIEFFKPRPDDLEQTYEIDDDYT